MLGIISQEHRPINKDPRIKNLPPKYPTNTEWQLPLTKETKRNIQTYKELQEALIQPQLEQIINDINKHFGNRLVSLRTILISQGPSETTITTEAGTTFTPPTAETLLRQGTEQPNKHTILVSPHKSGNTLEQHGRIFQYATGNTKTALLNLGITPAIILYDQAELKKANTPNSYEYKITGEPNQAILAIYPINIDIAR